MAVRSAVQQFDDAYEKARTAAVNSGHPSVIHIDGSRIWVEVDRTDGTGERTRIGRIVDLRYSGVEVATTTRSVCFDSTGTARVRGRCSAAGGRIRFSKGSSVRTVVTTAVGLIPA